MATSASRPSSAASATSPTTEKLYWADAHARALTFEAHGAALSSHGGRASIVLPRTLFYPEGGGQLGDAGALELGEDRHPVRVADTQIEDGAIHHVLQDGLPEALARAIQGGSGGSLAVRGHVDEARRRDHTVQHTAQHALSRALFDAVRAETVSARLGASSCTIDVSRAGMADADLYRAEDLVNAIVMSDVPVHASFPSADELAALVLRKQPNAEKSASGVRVVTIEGFDATPCGGTHCSRTGEIGQVRITATEKYKGMLRITFHAGTRALLDARAKHDLLTTLARDLTCGAQDVPGAVTKLRGEMRIARDRLESARGEIADLLASRLREALPRRDVQGPQVIAVARPADDLAGLRALAAKLTSDARVVALVAGPDEGSGELILVIQRGREGMLDAGAFVTAQAKSLGGRGGGRPERAEGRFPHGTSLDVLEAEAQAAISLLSSP